MDSFLKLGDPTLLHFARMFILAAIDVIGNIGVMPKTNNYWQLVESEIALGDSYTM